MRLFAGRDTQFTWLIWKTPCVALSGEDESEVDFEPRAIHHAQREPANSLNTTTLTRNISFTLVPRSGCCLWVSEGQPCVFKTQPVALGSNQPRSIQSQQGIRAGVEACYPTRVGAWASNNLVDTLPCNLATLQDVNYSEISILRRCFCCGRTGRLCMYNASWEDHS